MTFRVGEEVVCINASETAYPDERELVEGRIYTIRWSGPFSIPMRGQEVCVRIEGVVRPLCLLTQVNDMPFLARRFRRIARTDISIFTAMLVKTPESVA